MSDQPTAVAWCERVIRRSSSVVSTDDDRRTNENRMVCALLNDLLAVQLLVVELHDTLHRSPGMCGDPPGMCGDPRGEGWTGPRCQGLHPSPVHLGVEALLLAA